MSNKVTMTFEIRALIKVTAQSQGAAVNRAKQALRNLYWNQQGNHPTLGPYTSKLLQKERVIWREVL